jgi:RNA polymerase sigma-70 factor (ECF subfamily)
MAATDLAHATTAHHDEQVLVRRITEGDRSAFELMMRRYNRRLFRVARAALNDEAEAEDALQEAYLGAYRSIAQFRGDSALSTWLCRLVLNECLARQRRKARRHNVVPIVSADSDVSVVTMAADDADRPEKLLARAQMRAVLERKLGELPESFRIVFILRSVEELSVEETAESLGIPEATVRSRHFRAKNLLREALAHEFDLAERDVFDFAGTRCDRIVAWVLGRLPA